MTEEEFMEYSTSGSLYRLIVHVGTPLAVFALFSSLFSLLDTMMASHLGTIDVSTVAYLNQLRMILNSIGSGLITGSMILINRAYGAGEREKANDLLNMLIRIMLIVSAVFIAFIPFIPHLLRAIATPEEFIEEGTPYFRVMILATIVNFINLIYINIEKTRGRTSVIMIANIATMILKLVLTAFFIYILGKGIVFIALATLITYSAFAVYSLLRISEKNSIFSIAPQKIRKGGRGLAGKIIGISYPVTIEDAAFSLGKTVVNSIAASYGAEMIGALGISNSTTGLATKFENGFSDASSSIVSQNLGAGRPDRSVKAYRANIVITMLASLAAVSVLVIVRDPLIALFATSRDGVDAEFLSDIRRIFVYDILGCLALSLNGAGMDFLLGLGKTKITLVINFTRIFLLRIPVLLLLQHFIADGAAALGIMMMISNGCCAILTTSICIAVSRNLLRSRAAVQQKAQQE